MADFDEAGGVPALMRELRPLLHTDCLTALGGTLAEALDAFPDSPRREVIRPFDRPFAPTGGVAVLSGNLAPMGCVVKPAAVPDALHRFTGTARVFHSEQDACRAILDGKVPHGTAVVAALTRGPRAVPACRRCTVP